MAIATVDPSNGKTVQTFTAHTPAEVDAKLRRAVEAFARHRKTSFEDRARWLRAAADLLEKDQDRYARMMALEMGKPLEGGKGETAKCAAACRYYAENGARFLTDEKVEADKDHAFIAYQPLGAVLAVMPWNFPFWQVVRFAAPALMAGNVGLLKHASNVPQCALALEELFTRAGFIEGAFQTLLIGSKEVEAVIKDDRVAAVTLTGSNAAGASVAATAGKVFKKTVLELGGSDPFIVLASANVERAAEVAAKARVINNGQSCIAAKRFIVVDEVAEKFEKAFAKHLSALVVGPPTDPQTQVGPLASQQILDDLRKQVDTSVAKGARLVVGGKPEQREGFYYPPTLLADVPDDAPVSREETFGPVAALFRVPDALAAVAKANDSIYGLGSSVWTKDPAEQKLCIEELQAGSVFINAMVASDPRLPFGGVKQSGYGRELGALGIREFVNIKTVRLAAS
ncbi:MAG: NAD-dependent succinate-semialdehyde dehydrogenase [Myxococcaceae bacterium]